MSTGQGIKITISPVGGVLVEAQGFHDASCKAATLAFERALGGKQTVEDKPEANVPATGGHQEQHQSW